MFYFKRSKNIELNQTTRENFLIILTKLIQILSKENLTAQAQVVKTLVDLLSQKKEDEFIKLLNSIDMWGGSGAVWEVNIEDDYTAREFELEMIRLIDLMQKINVLGKGIKPIQKILKKNNEGKE